MNQDPTQKSYLEAHPFTQPEKERAIPPYDEIFPDEIPYSPTAHPLEFLEFCRSKLISIGKGLPTPRQERALYRDIDLMVFCGTDGAEMLENGTLGDRRETWGIKGHDFASMAKDAAAANDWEIHSTVQYATQHAETGGLPAMIVYDGAKMRRAVDMGDKDRHEDEFIVADGYSMDDATIAVFYLPE